jgi:chromosome partitioning protein
MRSIMVLNSKGGSGKSTVATSIASYYAAQGNKVMLVDLDPQASSLEWLSARPSGRSSITGVDGSAGHFRVPRSADYVVYDGAKHYYSGFTLAN